MSKHVKKNYLWGIILNQNFAANLLATFSDWFKHSFWLKMVIQLLAFLTLFWPFLDKNGQKLKKHHIFGKNWWIYLYGTNLFMRKKLWNGFLNQIFIFFQFWLSIKNPENFHKITKNGQKRPFLAKMSAQINLKMLPKVWQQNFE